MLSPYRVLDLTDEKGYMAGKILGDLGADVIKIEPPFGDQGRRIGPFFQDKPHPELSLYWIALNANKRSITLNIETETGREIFKKLIGKADIVIESFPPFYMDNIGLGYDELRKINKGIVMVSITPFGRRGPYSTYKATDLEVTAMSGFMSIVGDPDRPPVRISFPQSYMWSGAVAAMGAMVALYYRNLTGEGSYVDVSMQASTMLQMDEGWTFWPAVKQIMKRTGHYLAGRSFKGALIPSTYKCKDGYVAFPLYWGSVGAHTHREMVRWMDEKGMAPKYLKEMEWDKIDIWNLTQEEVDSITEPIAEFLKTVTKREFYERCIKFGMLGYPVSTAKDIYEDPQLLARDFWQKIKYPELDAEILHPGGFIKSSEAFCGIRRKAPRIGEHNEEVYVKELGLSRDELIELKEGGII